MSDALPPEYWERKDALPAFGVTSYYTCTACGKPCSPIICPQWGRPDVILSACCSAPVRVESAKE